MPIKTELGEKAYTVAEMSYILEEYAFKKTEQKTVAWFIQTLITHDFEKEPINKK